MEAPKPQLPEAQARVRDVVLTGGNNLRIIYNGDHYRTYSDPRLLIPETQAVSLENTAYFIKGGSQGHSVEQEMMTKIQTGQHSFLLDTLKRNEQIVLGTDVLLNPFTTVPALFAANIGALYALKRMWNNELEISRSTQEHRKRITRRDFLRRIALTLGTGVVGTDVAVAPVEFLVGGEVSYNIISAINMMRPDTKFISVYLRDIIIAEKIERLAKKHSLSRVAHYVGVGHAGEFEYAIGSQNRLKLLQMYKNAGLLDIFVWDKATLYSCPMLKYSNQSNKWMFGIEEVPEVKEIVLG